MRTYTGDNCDSTLLVVRTGPGIGHPGLFTTSGNDLLNLAKLMELNPAIAAINESNLLGTSFFAD